MNNKTEISFLDLASSSITVRRFMQVRLKSSSHHMIKSYFLKCLPCQCLPEQAASLIKREFTGCES